MKRIPFSESELLPNPNPRSFLKMFNPPITPAENLRMAVRGEIPYWIPGSETISFNPNIVPDNICRVFVHETEVPEQKGGPDMFGLDWIYVEEVGGSTVKPGNPILEDANDWKEVIHFPDIEKWDWAGCAARNKEYLGDGSMPVFSTHFTGMYERLISFMDFAEAAVALIDEEQQDAVHELFDALADLHCRIVDKEVEYFHIDGITFHDDWGSQMSTFFSTNTYREMLVPHIRKVVDHCHEKGIIFEMHSCGHNDRIAEVYAEMGVDMWRPQPMNDFDMVYRTVDGRYMMGMMLPPPKAGATDAEKEAAIRALLDRYSVPHHNIYLTNRAPDPQFTQFYYRVCREYLNEMAEKAGEA